MQRATGVTVAVLLVAAACVGCDGGSGTSTTTPEAQQKLVGMWYARFDATSSLPLGPAVSPAFGVLAFVRRATATDVQDLDKTTHAGVANIDLRTLGAEMPDPSHSIAIAARVSNSDNERDSLTFLLGADDNRRGVWMRGAWIGDSIVGTWTLLDARMYGARGRFVLSRWNATAAHD